MEFLKACSTNAQAISGFEAVAYQAFTVKRAPAAASTRPSDHQTLEDDVRPVEAALRQDRHLVAQDAVRPWLWFFRATTVDKAAVDPQDPPAVEGYEFQREQVGVMKALELARPALNRSANPNTQNDSFVIYELFTSAVVALISHYWVEHCNAVALNYRTFLSKPSPIDQDPPRDEADLYSVPFCLTNVNVYWASCGTLLVSIFSVNAPAIHCLNEISAPEMQTQLLGRCIRIAPNGALAKLVSFDDPLCAAAEDINRKRKRLKVGPAEQGIQRWKSIVTRWLSWKGYSIEGLEKKTSWIRIRLAQPSPSTASTPFQSNQSRDTLWPRALCFFYDGLDRTKVNLDSSTHPTLRCRALDWFATPHSGGFCDPVDRAQQWFLGKSQRDKALEEYRRAQQAEEEATRLKEESSGSLFPSSPLNSRAIAYGDLQAASGVYPTPPDGVAPGTAVSHSDCPSISGPPANAVLVPGGSHPAINLSAPQESAQSDEHQPPVTSPEFSLQFDNFNTSSGNDDLFEDMDEDGFDGNGVTDADFNFFDEPDGDDINMQEAPIALDNKPTPPKKGREKVLQTSSFDSKEGMSDPMAALENALASASNPSLGGEQEAKIVNPLNTQAPREAAGMGLDSPQHEPVQPPLSNAVQKEPTPLNPRHIQERLLPPPRETTSIQATETPQIGQHRDSIFDPISFNQKLRLSDAKYHSGRFSFPHEEPALSNTKAKSKPKSPASLRDLSLLTQIHYTIGVSTKSGVRETETSIRTEDDLSDMTSETSSFVEEEAEDTISLPVEPLSAGLTGPGKRKLPTDGNATPLSTTSYADSFGGDSLDLASVQTDEGSLALFEPNPWDWSLASVPPPIELQSTSGRYSVPAFSPITASFPNTPTSQPDISFEPPEDKPLSRNDNIAVAQVVTDQLISATLDILHEDASPSPRPDKRSQDPKLQNAIKVIFPKALDCSFAGLISVPDVFPELPSQAKGQQRPPLRKPNEGPAFPGSHILPLQPPQIRVRRSDNLWDFLPPAMAFWESLGLSPCSPAKNVSAICIYPHSDSLRPCLELFTVNMRIAYESCKLGNHGRVETIPDFDGGLVPWELSTPISNRAAFRTLRDKCVTLGKILAATHAQMRESDDARKTDAYVIYMINPFESASAVWELCSAFWILFQAYGQGSSGRTDLVPKPDLVLQIVPIECVASFDVPVVLNGSAYTSLAREVYDRCPPSAPSGDKAPLSIYSAPSFQLEEAIPRSIQFRLQAEPPQDLLRENSYIHIGYAISLDGNWVTTAWTDSWGKSRTTVSYNMGTRAFAEIAKEIWHTTIEICQARRVTWRLCIAKWGAMDREEMEVWGYLSTCSTPLNLFTTLLTVDPNSPLKLTPTVPTTNSQTSITHSSINTPGSTPQAGVSPDAHNVTPAATPAAEASADPSSDPDARLVDITDESWGVILSHRLHNSNSTVDFRPCLISGLLIKRGQTHTMTTPMPPTPDPERGPIVVGVNILWINAVTPTRAATTPFPPTGDVGISPGGSSSSAGPQGLNPSPVATERDRMSLMWTPTPQTRATAENLLKEILTQFRGLGTLARLKGIRGTRMGTVPWHVAVAKRGVEGLGSCVPV